MGAMSGIMGGGYRSNSVAEHHLGGSQSGEDCSPIADHGDRDRARISGVTCAVGNHRGSLSPPSPSPAASPRKNWSIFSRCRRASARRGGSCSITWATAYGRRFDNHWAFVRFAREQGLGLDLATPPKRPDPRESIETGCSRYPGPVSGATMTASVRRVHPGRDRIEWRGYLRKGYAVHVRKRSIEWRRR